MSMLKKFLISAAVAALPAMASSTASAVELNYGDLIGTWCQGGQGCFDNPNGSGNNAATIGQYILDQYPGAFELADFQYGGGSETWLGTQTSNGDPLTGFEFAKVNGDNGTWEYHGVPDTDAAVDLYLAVKYGNNFSIFFYDHVEVGDTGKFTNNIATYNAGPNDNADGPVTVCPDGYSFGANCMAVNYSGNPNAPGGRIPGDAPGISHVVSYWPPDGEGDVPEPAMLGLFGAALIGFGVLRRRRKAA